MSCKCGKCWEGRTGLHHGVAEGYFRGPPPVPESMVLGLKLALWIRTLFLGLMDVWNCGRKVYCWGLNCCLVARSDHTFLLGWEETAKSQVVG